MNAIKLALNCYFIQSYKLCSADVKERFGIFRNLSCLGYATWRNRSLHRESRYCGFYSHPFALTVVAWCRSVETRHLLIRRGEEGKIVLFLILFFSFKVGPKLNSTCCYVDLYIWLINCYLSSQTNHFSLLSNSYPIIRHVEGWARKEIHANFQGKIMFQDLSSQLSVKLYILFEISYYCIAICCPRVNFTWISSITFIGLNSLCSKLSIKQMSLH